MKKNNMLLKDDTKLHSFNQYVLVSLLFDETSVTIVISILALIMMETSCNTLILFTGNSKYEVLNLKL